MRKVQHYAIALWKVPVGPAVTALLGFILATVFLLLFASDLSLIFEDDINGLIVSFVLCGLGVGLGFILLRHLAPRREPMSLFGSGGVAVQPATQAEVCSQTIESWLGGTENTRPLHRVARVTPVMKSPRSERVATYNTHDSAAALGLVTIIGLGSALAMRFTDGWQFLLLTVLAGCSLALVLYLSRNSRASNIPGYKIPVAGGVIGIAALIGVGLVMVRFGFLRYFLGLAILAGASIALGINWSRRRENSSSTFI